MCRYLSLPLLLATVLAAAPASAQRASLAERVAALEAQAAAGRGNTDLVNQIAQLRSEVQALRAQVEELQHQLEQQKQTGRSQYLDLDGRLNRLEGGGAGAPPTAAAPTAKPPAPAAKAPAPATASESEPAIYGDRGKLAETADERGAYHAAFDILKAGRYAESARAFQDFLQAYPNGAYTPNALYWLGESYYVTQNYALALQQFQALLNRYPTHDKAPGALLKLGLSQYGLKQMAAAEATLAQVVARYPGTDAARTAEDRLHAIRFGSVR
jgi:tol-pal system protein YbgF